MTACVPALCHCSTWKPYNRSAHYNAGQDTCLNCNLQPATLLHVEMCSSALHTLSARLCPLHSQDEVVITKSIQLLNGTRCIFFVHKVDKSKPAVLMGLAVVSNVDPRDWPKC